MFDNRKDPMIATVQKVMDENARRRQIEADLNEELGIQDRKQLGHEKHDLYDQALLQRINEAVLSPKQKSLAAIAGNPKKIDAPDLAKLRDMKNEAANEEPPFDPDPPRKKRPDEPKTAKGLAKAAMRDMIAKADKAKPKQNMEEEQIDEERKRTSAVSSAFLAGKPAKQKELQTNGQEMTYHGNVIAKHAGDEVHVTTAGYGHSPSTRGHINGVLNRLGAPGLSQKKGKLMHGDTEVGTRDWIKIKKPTATMSEEQIDELSKKTLGSYIKKASHDAAHKSAIVGKMALQSRTKYDDMDFVGSRKDIDAADKSFGKSWKRREGIAKAVDKLTNEEEQIDEVLDSPMKKLGYMVKAGLSTVKTRGTLDALHNNGASKENTAAIADTRRTLGKRKEGYNLIQKRSGPESIAAKMPTMNKLTEEDFSLESIQEEIRNNLLERANSLLEHGSQEQIVEFMNDLTMEQRSILNMQEGLGDLVRGAIAGIRGGSRASNAAALGNKATQAGADAGAAVRKAVGDVPDAIKANPLKSVAAGVAGGAAVGGAGVAALSGSNPKTQAPTPAPRAPTGDQERSDADNNSNNPLTSAKPAAAKPASPASAPASAPRAPRASSAAPAARPEIRRTGENGEETAQDFNYNQANGAYNEPKAAAAPRAARAAPAAAAAAAKPAAASTATSAPRKGTDIGSPLTGGSSDERRDPKPERLGDPKYHQQQDAAANLAGLQKSATDSAEKTADAFGPGTKTAKPAAKPVDAPTDRETNSLSESRNFERFLRNR